MPDSDRELMKQVLGEVRFNDLKLLFRNGVTWQGEDYSVGFSFLGIGTAKLGKFRGEDGLLRHGTFHRLFIDDFVHGSFFDANSGDNDPNHQATMEHASWVANRYLENEEIQDFVKGAKSQNPAYLAAKNLFHMGNWTPEFIGGLVFGNLTPEELMKIRSEGLAEMRSPTPQYGGFAGYVKNNLVKGRFTYDLGSYTENISDFGDNLFEALCADQAEHQERYFLTNPAKEMIK